VRQRQASPLFPDGVERQHWDHLLTRELAAARERVAAGPVTPTIDYPAFRAELADFDFQTPRETAMLLSCAIAQLEHGLVPPVVDSE